VRIPDIIRKKRDGGRLTEEEITYFVSGVTDGSIPDYQASALLMAACIRGMTDEETTALTKAMLRSGSTLDTRDIPGMKIDKHSTGGVGDKTSIILAPLMAAMGTRVPMISGRGLGHTLWISWRPSPDSGRTSRRKNRLDSSARWDVLWQGSHKALFLRTGDSMPCAT
jgi:thymidine phosphorylase